MEYVCPRIAVELGSRASLNKSSDLMPEAFGRAPLHVQTRSDRKRRAYAWRIPRCRLLPATLFRLTLTRVDLLGVRRFSALEVDWQWDRSQGVMAPIMAGISRTR